MATQDFGLSYTVTHPVFWNDTSKGKVGEAGGIFSDLVVLDTIGEAGSIFADLVVLDKIGEAGSLFADIVVLDKIGESSSLDVTNLCTLRNILMPPLVSTLSGPLMSTMNCIDDFSLAKFIGLRANLEVYYKLNDNGMDSSINNRNLTFTGTEAYAAGKFNSGYDLSGDSADFAEGPTNIALSLAGAGAKWTIQYWARYNVTALRLALEKFEFGGGLNGWSTYKTGGGGLTFESPGAVGINTTSTPLSAPGSAFHHIIYRSTGTVFSIWVNGVSQPLDTTIPPTIVHVGSVPLLIGQRIGGGFPFDGQLDEIAIWSRDLSDAEIAELYNSGAGLEIPLS